MRADRRRLPFTIGTDKHASYPEAFATSVKEKVLPADCKLRQVKYHNNIIKRLDGRDSIGEARFVESLFGIAA